MILKHRLSFRHIMFNKENVFLNTNKKQSIVVINLLSIYYQSIMITNRGFL